MNNRKKRDKSIQAVIRQARAQGRAEAVSILAGISPEDDLDGLVGCSPNGDAGDYSSYWKTDALRKLLSADSEVCDKIDRLQGAHEWAFYLEYDLARARENLGKALPDAARYQHLKDTWADGGLLERLDANVKPEHWDATIDADIGRTGGMGADMAAMTMGIALTDEQLLVAMGRAREMIKRAREPWSQSQEAEFSAMVRRGTEACVGPVMARQMFPGAYVDQPAPAELSGKVSVDE